MVAEDGDLIEIGKSCRIAGRVPAGMTFVDGIGIGDVGEVVLRDRRKLSDDGIAVVVVAVDSRTGRPTGPPDLVTRGFVYEETSGDILEEARNRVMLSLQEAPGDGLVDRNVLEQTIRRTLGKYFWEITQRKPVVVPVIMEV
jgi:ribonuclease J